MRFSATSSPPTHPSSRSPSRKLKTLTLLLSFVATLSLVSAQKQTILLTFQDDNGAAIDNPLTIPLSECIPFNTTTLLPDTEGSYASAVASDTQAALNLYSGPYCQILQTGAVGMWNNTDATAGIASIRWEGSSTDLPGTLNPAGFPLINPPKSNETGSETGSDTKHNGTKTSNSDDTFIMDPSKGRVLVGLVSAILAVGIIIGVYLVYEAAQYIPPPKKPKKTAGEGGGIVGAKKVKKGQAYYKKPPKEDFGAGIGGSASAVENNRSNSMLLAPTSMQERPRHDRSSFASVASATVPTFVPRIPPRPTSTFTPNDSVLINILQDPVPSSNNNNTWASDLIQFGNDTPPYNTTPSTSGRAGEVLVPMHLLDGQQSPTRRIPGRPT
ncbi:hypothetical protein BGZ80_001195 [Entomortierella chlamydospora]|uniref:Uncharacterized protein n=1 Tax=Entomortierella chlamydospora TaxID=101097 RepID=A0A9P6SXX6_9FUNG|nr:hypothetical protein BGZ79_002454 [Entomortierella chlamydospora]KAG0010767.1 hypothetical protein BGZ80_001195 [Entomortierella chlamydospora]